MYLGLYGGEAVVIREFHPVESSGLGGSEIEHMKVCLKSVISGDEAVRKVVTRK